MSKYVNANEIAKEKGLYLKVVTSVKSFENYNSFYNIYDEFEEPCRRIVVLTKNDILEEVYDENPSEKIVNGKIVDDNLWIKDYELLVNPNKIDLEKIVVSKKLVEEFIMI